MEARVRGASGAPALRMAPLVTTGVIQSAAAAALARARFGYSIGRARMTADEFEVWFEKGVTDGLPVVPPTRERVERMLAGTRRSRDELVGDMTPNYGRLTAEKAPINPPTPGSRPDFPPPLL